MFHEKNELVSSASSLTNRRGTTTIDIHFLVQSIRLRRNPGISLTLFRHTCSPRSRFHKAFDHRGMT
jgi:hypothetical protein